jgi:hypothetical protein
MNTYGTTGGRADAHGEGEITVHGEFVMLAPVRVQPAHPHVVVLCALGMRKRGGRKRVAVVKVMEVVKVGEVKEELAREYEVRGGGEERV